MSIKAIFYSKFDTQEGLPPQTLVKTLTDHLTGPKVVHQVPEDAIVPQSPSSTPTFVPFPDISFFVIPRQELCGNFIQFCKEGYRILGYPVCIKSPQYDRNEFIFNFCIILSEDEPFSSYRTVVQKLAHLMKSLEEQNHFLSTDPSSPGSGKIYSLCEILMEDLNNYCECMIPIDDLNTINIKLFPTYPPPPPVKAWQVPLFTIRPETLMDENWDLTMQRVIPYINGVSSVKQIALLADADFSLTKKCIKHLLYYGCCLLLDIFSFSAIYAPTAEFSRTIACDPAMQRECARYVNTAFAPPPPPPPPSSSPTDDNNNNNHPDPHNDIHPPTPQSNLTTPSIWPLTSTDPPTRLDALTIIELYASLRQGQSVRQWYALHADTLSHIDVRRFITFGVIKGFLYRVHKYAFATGHAKGSGNSGGGVGVGVGQQDDDEDRLQDSTTTTTATTDFHIPHEADNAAAAGDLRVHSSITSSADVDQYSSSASSPSFSDSSSSSRDEITDETLEPYLDGNHCFDQICTELEISEKEVVGRIRRWEGRKGAGGGGGGGEVMIIHR
ncbi:MAG: hypothetical protein Q9227_000483 [Pyrenula ochraceoflavens]